MCSSPAVLRAALIARHDHPDPLVHTLLLDRDGRLFLDQRMANLVAWAAALA